MHNVILLSISFHIRYDFKVSNSNGSVEGSITLVVQEREERDISSQKINFESNLVEQTDFGEYVASLHACNNSTFNLQYQVGSLL